MPRIADILGAEELRALGAPQRMMEQDDPNSEQGTDPNQPNQQQTGEPDPPGMSNISQYVQFLQKAGYEFLGHESDNGGQQFGSSFKGPDGDMIIVKYDGSWTRIGPGNTRGSGPDIKSLGQNIMRDQLRVGDDKDHNNALRQAGYLKIHKDSQGNTYYKHPQSGRTISVDKSGKWGSSAGTGHGATNLRQFLQQEGEQQQGEQAAQFQQNQKMKQKGQAQGGGRPGMGGGRGQGGGGRF